LNVFSLIRALFSGKDSTESYLYCFYEAKGMLD